MSYWGEHSNHSDCPCSPTTSISTTAGAQEGTWKVTRHLVHNAPTQLIEDLGMMARDQLNDYLQSQGANNWMIP